MIKDLSNLGGLLLGADFHYSLVMDFLESLKESASLELLKELNEVLKDAKIVEEGLSLAAEEVLLLETIHGDD